MKIKLSSDQIFKFILWNRNFLIPQKFSFVLNVHLLPGLSHILVALFLCFPEILLDATKIPFYQFEHIPDMFERKSRGILERNLEFDKRNFEILNFRKDQLST